MGGALRVLQAADLRVDEPPAICGQLPEELKNIAAGARERAADRLFRCARESRADLLLLTGPLAEFPCEPRLECWFDRHFEELQRVGTTVVWASDSPQDLCRADKFPANVRILAPGQSIAFPLSRTVRTVEAHWNRQPRGRTEPLGGCDLAITLESSARSIDIAYHAREGSSAAHCVAVPLQPGQWRLGTPSGFWVVECDPVAAPRAALQPAAGVAWIHEELDIAAGTTVEQLRSQLSDRVRTLRSHAVAELSIVDFQLPTRDPALVVELDHRRLADMLESLRTTAVAETPHVWCAGIELRPADNARLELSEHPVVSVGLAELEQVLRDDVVRHLPEQWRPEARWLTDWDQRRSLRDLKLRVLRELAAAQELVT